MPGCSNQHLRGNEVAMAIKFVCTSWATDGTASEPAKTMHSHSDPDSFCVRNFSHLSTDNYIICLVSFKEEPAKTMHSQSDLDSFCVRKLLTPFT